MNEIDRRIREALDADDRDWFEDFSAEPGIHEQLLETFRGKMWFLNLMTLLFGIVFMIITVMVAIRFFRAEEVREQIAYATGFVVCMLIILGMKIWYWMVLNRNMVTREVKRVELQLAHLSNRIGQGERSS